MRVLMFGWEFPPMASGGLGTACHGLTKGLKNNNVDVIFVMPKVPENVNSEHLEFISANDVLLRDQYGQLQELITVGSMLSPYMTNEEYLQKMNGIDVSMHMRGRVHYGRSKNLASIYGSNLFDEVWRYRQKAKLIAISKDYDVIHCHDWMTYGAGIEAKRLSGKPLVLHVHATEFDRTGNHPNEYVYQLEREGFSQADKIITVSAYTKQRVMEHYGIPEFKIDVIHNAVAFTHPPQDSSRLNEGDKIVLFLGRITIQKGPDWFIYAARKVCDYFPNVKFILAGSGDMEPFVINKVVELGLTDKVLFAGFLSGADIDRAYQMADLYVMPSISEPFGITPLEAMRNGTPVLISKQSGVSEVVSHCLKADFWDVDEMANKIIGVLSHQSLKQELRDRGLEEVKKFNWDDSARKCVDVYRSVGA